MSALPSGNERLFQQGLNVRGVFVFGSASSAQEITLYNQADGSVVVLAADEILVIDTFEIRSTASGFVILFFDNDQAADDSVQSQWASTSLVTAGTSYFRRWSERSAPQGEAEGKPFVSISAESDIAGIITGFIRKIVPKALQPAKV